MKLQSLAVIFIIIILPISLILSAYTGNQIKTLNLQTSYDSKLTTATYDAVKAFQINTLNDSTSDSATSKIRDIEASVETFFNSVSENFSISEGNKEGIKDYVPALVYTMYDGFYIYTPFTNSLPEGYTFEEGTTSADENGQKIYGLKPYIYYSCRYQPDDNSDFVITYSLDNYISIQGKIGNENWNVSGYLLDGDYSSYINSEKLTENVLEYSNLPYIQENGTKYYYDKDNNQVFSIVSGDKKYINSNLKSQYISKITSNSNSATQYYKLAEEFTQLVRGNSILKNLTFGDAVDTFIDSDGNAKTEKISDKYSVTDNNEYLNGFSGDNKIFVSDSSTNIEDSASNFNEHRTAVIRYAIQKNLSVAIANFNDYSGLINQFQMPQLSETEWYSIINNTSVISFLQGMSIGGKIYNGYSVVTNNKNKEVVSEDTIYITTNTNNYKEYHQITCSDLNSEVITAGEYNINFERRTYIDSTTKETKYYFPKVHMGCYNCIVNQPSTDELTTYIVQYVRDNKNLSKAVKKAYFTALGRERYNMYRVNYETYANNYTGDNASDTNNWKYINTIN